MTPAIRSELARVFETDARTDVEPEDAEPHRFAPTNEERRHLLDTARQIVRDGLVWLYEQGSTPDHAHALLCARGRPTLALLVQVRRSQRALEAAKDFRAKADLLDIGVIASGWFEPRDLPRPSPKAMKEVAAALRWAALVFERYAAKQGPEPVDTHTKLMLRP